MALKSKTSSWLDWPDFGPLGSSLAMRFAIRVRGHPARTATLRLPKPDPLIPDTSQGFGTLSILIMALPLTKYISDKGWNPAPSMT